MGKRGVAVVIEDDDDIRSSLTGLLQQSGFAVHARSSGFEGVEAVRKHEPDVVTVDLGLADFDGIEALRRIRTFSDAYLIILAARPDEADAVLAFTAGADDYLPKAFRPRELRARIAAMLRRPRTAHVAAAGLLTGLVELPPAAQRSRDTPSSEPETPAEDPTTADPDFSHRGLTVHEGGRRAAVHGVPLDLTRTEFDLLLYLMKNGRAVRTKADLVRWLRNDPYNTGSFVSEREERAVEVHLSNLRRRLGDSPRKPRWVETVRGLGYRLTP
ncbi:DNA-binding response regulator [Arthrobacter sp. 9AX]|uniref:response regulator transcription factor n=1 Tax=Arthrobacter sp. 9AX TaxID=2653131 RepID=UPI0012F19565|nr:response regulator transcription factor [Arthrobacter sp. 9AX]VXB82035.1 DNA-binding response regulator [Arthrobacter sp. 9AX]